MEPTVRSAPLGSLRLVLLAMVAALVLVPDTAIQAQSTTSSLRIEVKDEAGNAIPGVALTLTHLPTGRIQAYVANDGGVVTARGLAIGGPYAITLPDGGEYAADSVSDIQLELGETEVIELTVRPAQFEEITVTASQVADELEIGVGREFSEETIAAVPTISRDFVDTISTEPEILVDDTEDRGPAVSMAGQNFRYNSVTIDGVAQNDNFGLSKNASATQRAPISIDAIEAISVTLAPYDVTYGNFVGGNINIVTKSGSNDFRGSAYAFTTEDSLTGDESDGVDLGIGEFDEQVYGFTLGGPIVTDKLFFFANYELFETTRPSNTQTIDSIAGVSQADVDQAIAIFNDVYGFDPGRFATTDDDEDEKILLNLGWNVNESHRVDATYQVADGDVLFDDFPDIAALQSNRYNINEKLTAISAQLFSNWSPTFTSEVKLGSKDVENRQISVDPTTPDFTVSTAGGGTIAAGGDRFRHTNQLDNDSQVFRLRGDYQWTDHLVTFGLEQEEYTIRNAFLPFSNGNYVFGSLDALAAREPLFVLYGNSNTGVADDAETNFDLAVNSAYVQNEWNATDSLTLKLGLRYDWYENDDEIVANPFFQARNGFSNQENLDGKDLLLPRFGFSWAPTDRVTLRGGAGLFGGGTPLIMLSNSYAGNGITRTFAAFLAPFFGPPVSTAIENAVAALPDPGAAFEFLQPFIGVNPVGDVDAIDPDFEILSSWKYSLGGNFVLGDQWLIDAHLVFSDVKDGYDIVETRRQQVATAPDGRPIYDIPAGGDYVVTNTSEGSSTVFSLSVDKFFDTRSAGRFDLNVGYTFQDVDEIRSYNRFVGFETYAFDPQADLNDPELAASKYEVEDRFTATMRWQEQILGDSTTSVGLVYQGRSGRNFSYVFGSGGNPTFGGTFLADFGSEGDNPGAHLFYVPTGIDDPIVTGDPGFLADLNEFIDGDNCLSGARGTIIERNSCSTGWIHIFSLRLQQEIRAWGDSGFDVILDIENLGNLLDDSWGRIESYPSPSNVAVAIVGLNADGTQYVLTPNASYDGTVDSVVPDPVIARISSAYRVQLGLRFRF